jgi:hypothetical protein
MKLFRSFYRPVSKQLFSALPCFPVKQEKVKFSFPPAEQPSRYFVLLIITYIPNQLKTKYYESKYQ